MPWNDQQDQDPGSWRIVNSRPFWATPQLGNLWFFAAKVVKGNSASRKETKTRRCCYVLFGSFLFPSFCSRMRVFAANLPSPNCLWKKNHMPHQNRHFQLTEFQFVDWKQSVLLRKKPSLEEVFATFDINSFKVRSDCDGGGGKFSGMIYIAIQESGQNTLVFLIFPTILNNRNFCFGWAHINIYTSLIKDFEEYLLSRNRRY